MGSWLPTHIRAAPNLDVGIHFEILFENKVLMLKKVFQTTELAQ